MYDNQVWDIASTLKPSRRGELEITDVNNAYIEKGQLTYNTLKGFWLDSGSSFRHLLKASLWSAKHQGLDIAELASEKGVSQIHVSVSTQASFAVAIAVIETG